jgi:uncharacterized membrane protein
MLSSYITTASGGEWILEWIEYAALAVEVLAVLIIVVTIFYAMIEYMIKGIRAHNIEYRYQELKVSLGKALLLGLEILVAADVIRTVALEATIESVVTLGLLVLIRTFLSWALVVEIEGRWPWQLPPRSE